MFCIANTPPSSLMESTVNPKVNNKRRQSQGTLLDSQHFGGRRVCQSFRMGLGRLANTSITHTNLQKPNNKLVCAQLEHFGARMSHGQRQTHKIQHGPDLGGSHHLPPYSILCAQSRDQHPNVILSQDSRMGVLKFPQLGFP